MYNNGLGRDETLTPSLSRITASLLTARVQIGFNTFHRSFVFFSPKALEQFLESLNNFSSPKANTQTKIAGPSSETIIFCLPNWYFYHSYLQNHWILFCECKKQSVVFRPVKGTHDCSQAIGTAPFIPFFFLDQSTSSCFWYSLIVFRLQSLRFHDGTVAWHKTPY